MALNRDVVEAMVSDFRSKVCGRSLDPKNLAYERIMSRLPRPEKHRLRVLRVVDPEMLLNFSDVEKAYIIANTCTDGVIHSHASLPRLQVEKLARLIFCDDDGFLMNNILVLRYKNALHVIGGRHRLIVLLLMGVIDGNSEVDVLVRDAKSEAELHIAAIRDNDARRVGTRERDIGNIMWANEKFEGTEKEKKLLRSLAALISARLSTESSKLLGKSAVSLPFMIDDRFHGTAKLMSFRNVTRGGAMFCKSVKRHAIDRQMDMLEDMYLPYFVWFMSRFYTVSCALGKMGEEAFFKLFRSSNNDAATHICKVVEYFVFRDNVSPSEKVFQTIAEDVIRKLSILVGDNECNGAEMMKAKLLKALYGEDRSTLFKVADVVFPGTVGKVMEQLKRCKLQTREKQKKLLNEETEDEF